jgi:hypothetical protein
MRIERKDAQGIRLSQELFKQVHFGNLRFGGGQIFSFDGFVHLMSMDRNMARRGDSDFDVAGSNAEYRHFYFIANNETLIPFSRKD